MSGILFPWRLYAPRELWQKSSSVLDSCKGASKTALHTACAVGNEIFAEVILEVGCGPNILTTEAKGNMCSVVDVVLKGQPSNLFRRLFRDYSMYAVQGILQKPSSKLPPSRTSCEPAGNGSSAPCWLGASDLAE